MLGNIENVKKKKFIFDKKIALVQVEDNVLKVEYKKRAIPKIITFMMLMCALAYVFFVFCPLEFVQKWRNIYIETAMSTMNHQWLAEYFIPKHIIDEVMENVNANLEDNMIYSSEIPPEEKPKEENKVVVSEKELFCSYFKEIDKSTIPNNFKYGNVQISDISNLGIKTVAGDAVWAIDEINGILIVEIKENNYQGKLAIVKDSSKVFLAANTKAKKGSTVTALCNQYNGVLAINGSAFADENGVGSGNASVGYVKSQDNVKSSKILGSPYQLAGFDENDNFLVGYGLDVKELRDACQFFPIIICNGENKIKGTGGMGIQPRTVIGQTKDKSTIFLVIDGRQAGYSVGATMADCAKILLRYDAYNAMNLDGGSSSSMTYMGKMITKTSSPMVDGRYLPNAWVVEGNIKENN